MNKAKTLNALLEKEGEMEPHLDKAAEHLHQAALAIEKSIKSSTDNTVSPREIKLMRSIELKIERLAKMVKGELDYE